MNLDPDEYQETRHNCRVMLTFAEIMWDTLNDTGIPPHIQEQMFLAWWKTTVQPKLELPDFSALFNQDNL